MSSFHEHSSHFQLHLTFLFQQIRGPGYHETITQMFIQLIDLAVSEYKKTKGPYSFEDFIATAPHLTSKNLIFEYYSPEVIKSQKAKLEYLLNSY